MMRVLAILLALLSSPVAANTGDHHAWEVRSGASTLLKIEAVEEPTGWLATLLRPAALSIEGDTLIVDDPAPAVYQSVSATRQDDRLDLTFRSAGGVPMRFAIQMGAAGAATLDIGGILPDPIRLEPAPFLPRLFGLEPGGRYPLDLERPTNAEMTAIFAADQADRGAGQNIDWSVVGPRNAARLARTSALLDAGALRNGDDFYHAASVFQHGGDAAAFMKAHLLGTAAVARGRADALWIAGAPLDRYLQAIGQPQALGTQYSLPKGQPATRELYDRAMASDRLRQLFGTGTLAEQEQRRRGYDENRAAR